MEESLLLPTPLYIHIEPWHDLTLREYFTDHITEHLGAHSIELTEAEDYKLCFDNSFRPISEKLVFIDLLFNSCQEGKDADNWAKEVEPQNMLVIR
ncbi:unnamed protein product [Caretta caretta]